MCLKPLKQNSPDVYNYIKDKVKEVIAFSAGHCGINHLCDHIVKVEGFNGTGGRKSTVGDTESAANQIEDGGAAEIKDIVKGDIGKL